MKKNSRRLPKGYNGTAFTTRRVSDIVPYVLSAIQKKHEERHDLILTAWPNIVGPQIAKFTKPESFIEGVLRVRVNNSSLYSLLVQSEKGKLLTLLRTKFPKVQIDRIFFRMG